MAVSLTKEEFLERLLQRHTQFEDNLVERTKPKYPIILNSWEALAEFCVDVLDSYIDAVFDEET